MNPVSGIVAFILERVIKQTQFAGYRSYFGGASGILGGVVLILDMLAKGQFDPTTMTAAWVAIAAGYAVIGNAGKKDAALAVQQQLLAATQVAGEEQVAATEVAADNKQVAATKAAAKAPSKSSTK